MRNILFVPIGLVIFLAPVGLAVIEVEDAEEDAYFSDPVIYHAHLPPAESPDTLYETLAYTPAEVRADEATVPRRFMAALPRGLGEVERAQERKRMFIATMLPLILRVNELIANDRERLLRLTEKLENGADLDTAQREWLKLLAEEYKLGPAETVEDIDFVQLRRRVDIIPPSLALAQAAIESGWGTSRFARMGNAIFGQWTWNAEDKGIVPSGRPEGRTYRVRAFDFLIDSVRGYARNLNTAPAYRELRRIRAQQRAQGQPLSGLALAGGLIRYSERGAPYIADLRSIIKANRLQEFNSVALAPRPSLPIG